MVSIRTVVPVIISTQIAVAVGVTGVISFINGQKAVNDVASQLREQIAVRIDNHVSGYLETPRLVLGSMANQFRVGLLSPQNLMAPENLPQTERYLWNQSYLFDSVGYLLISNEQGEYVGVERLDDGVRRIDLADGKTDRRFRTYSVDRQGNHDQLLKRSDNPYDPRDRPYYKAAVKAQKQGWTEVYNAFGYDNRPTITAAQPVYQQQSNGQPGELLGVVGVDLILSQISQFLGELEISQSGLAFIIEPSGNLIATSKGEAVIAADENLQNQRVLASNSGTPLIQETAKFLQKRYGSFQINEDGQLDFSVDGKRNFVEVRSLQQFDLNWIIIVVIPEADFMEQINANTRTTAILCLTSLIIASIVGLLTARRLTRPIMALSKASTAIEAETYTPEMLEQELKRKDEFGQLARIFYVMAEQVRNRAGDLRDRIRQLEVEVDQTKRGSSLQDSDDLLLVRELLQRAREVRSK
ncbi:MAG: hypothetical protein MUF49_10150 [Oculatellaceae cyanobacterium Prado106]|jgi:HAMP domain-containing protein|nr:hypothetical protein [Oculatellaceae cyanobacterium Prado106]